MATTARSKNPERRLSKAGALLLATRGDPRSERAGGPGRAGGARRPRRTRIFASQGIPLPGVGVLLRAWLVLNNRGKFAMLDQEVRRWSATDAAELYDIAR